jgi:hypothetical protein
MGALLPHPNSYNGRDTKFSVLLVSPESVTEYAKQNDVGQSLTDQIEGAINQRLEDVQAAGGYVVHIEYNMSHGALFFAAITVAMAYPKTDEEKA